MLYLELMILTSQQTAAEGEEMGKTGPQEMRLSWCTSRCKTPGNTSHICLTFKFRINVHLSPRNLYVGQKATVRTGHGTTDWFKIGKGV